MTFCLVTKGSCDSFSLFISFLRMTFMIYNDIHWFMMVYIRIKLDTINGNFFHTAIVEVLLRYTIEDSMVTFFSMGLDTLSAVF